jgi:signal transduction histidine kinase
MELNCLSRASPRGAECFGVTSFRTALLMNSTAPEIHAAQAELAEAHRRTNALAYFSRRMAHDLSNFLTVIRTYSELMLADLPQDHPNRADLDEIAQAADTTVAYMQRCSAFGRAASSKAAPLELDTLLADVIRQEQLASTVPLTSAGASNARVHMNAAVLAEALHELIHNAREASPAGIVIRVDQIAVDAERIDAGVPIGAGPWAIIDVIDNGAGIHESVATNLFDPFVTTKNGVRGAGLGLAIARAAAWAAGGQLTIQHANGETVCRMYLPVLPRD